jgi:hypothetical protein
MEINTAIVTKRISFRPAYPVTHFTVNLKKPLDMRPIIPMIDVKSERFADGFDSDSWLGTHKSKHGTICFSRKCIQFIVRSENECNISKKLVPLIERVFGVRVDRRLTDEGEEWTIRRKTGKEKFVGYLETFWEDMGFE